MKNKFLAFCIAIITVSNFALSQSKPLSKKNAPQLEEYVLSEHIILVANGKETNIFDINPSNIQRLLGKPAYIKKERSEIDGEIHRTYFYDNGEIEFDGQKNVYDLDIKKPGWAFILKVNNKITKPFTIGTSLEQVKSIFPHNFSEADYEDRKYIFNVWLITKTGVPVDSFVQFRIKDGHVVYMSFAEDDS